MCSGAMYSDENDVSDISLSLYSHREYLRPLDQMPTQYCAN